MLQLFLPFMFKVIISYVLPKCSVNLAKEGWLILAGGSQDQSKKDQKNRTDELILPTTTPNNCITYIIHKGLV